MSESGSAVVDTFVSANSSETSSVVVLDDVNQRGDETPEISNMASWKDDPPVIVGMGMFLLFL